MTIYDKKCQSFGHVFIKFLGQPRRWGFQKCQSFKIWIFWVVHHQRWGSSDPVAAAKMIFNISFPLSVQVRIFLFIAKLIFYLLEEIIHHVTWLVFTYSFCVVLHLLYSIFCSQETQNTH